MDANIKGAVVALFIVIALFGLVAMGDHFLVSVRRPTRRSKAQLPPCGKNRTCLSIDAALKRFGRWFQSGFGKLLAGILRDS